jgi:carboxymethylenebutenolidase
MTDRITIEGRNGAFSAYLARPRTSPAPAVVVLHEVFGVNADIRKTCDELGEQGFIAVALLPSSDSTTFSGPRA